MANKTLYKSYYTIFIFFMITPINHYAFKYIMQPLKTFCFCNTDLRVLAKTRVVIKTRVAKNIVLWLCAIFHTRTPQPSLIAESRVIFHVARAAFVIKS